MPNDGVIPTREERYWSYVDRVEHLRNYPWPIDPKDQPAFDREIRWNQRRAFFARWGRGLAILCGIHLAVLVMSTGYSLGFAAGQGNVLDAVCQVAGQSFDAASKTCTDQ